MAISLGFGVLFATVIVLLLIPSLFVLMDDVERLFARVWQRIVARRQMGRDLRSIHR